MNNFKKNENNKKKKIIKEAWYEFMVIFDINNFNNSINKCIFNENKI